MHQVPSSTTAADVISRGGKRSSLEPKSCSRGQSQDSRAKQLLLLPQIPGHANPAAWPRCHQRIITGAPSCASAGNTHAPARLALRTPCPRPRSCPPLGSCTLREGGCRAPEGSTEELMWRSAGLRRRRSRFPRLRSSRIAAPRHLKAITIPNAAGSTYIVSTDRHIASRAATQAIDLNGPMDLLWL